MALSAATVWEFRAGSTAANVNGGGFVAGASGTDYSQQTAAQYTFTDLASTNGTGAAPVVTSASHNFVATDVGNIMHINSGTNWTAGWYQIVSCATNAATLDRACGSSATLSAGTYHVGGALSLNDASDTTVASTMVAGNTIWFNGSLTIGGTFTVTAGTATTPIQLLGYASSRGDNPLGATRPTITCGAFTFNPGGSNLSQYIIFTGTNTNTYTSGASITRYCKFINTSITAARAAFNSSVTARAIGCEMVSYRGNAINGAGTFYGCYIHDSDTGVNDSTSTALTIIDCIFSGHVTTAINKANTSSTVMNIYGNTIYGAENKLGTGFLINSGQVEILAYNNIIYGFVTGVNDGNGVGVNYGDYNNFFNNTTDKTGWTAGAHDLAVNPSFINLNQYTGTSATTSGFVLTDGAANFANVTDNQDFCYISTGTGVTVGQYMITAHTTTTLTLDLAPGTSAVADKRYQVTYGRNYGIGTNLQGTAFPAAFPSVPTTGFPDTGAVSRNTPADYTDPGINNVRNATTYLYTNLTKTGNLVIPTTGQVEIGITFGSSSSLTGTYDGSDRWTDPGISNVANGITYKANSTSNNRTGNVVSPATGDVRAGVTYGSSSGLTGTYDPITGNYTDPGISHVQSGTSYRFAGSTEVGTYDPITGNYTDPGTSNVRAGITYKFAGALEAGTYSAPVNQFLKQALQADFTTKLLSGPLWVSQSGIITTSLGTASYEIFNINGTTTGISQSGISAAASGLFFITPVDVTALIGVKEYIVQINISISSVVYTDYQPLLLDNTLSIVNMNTRTTKNIVISEI